MSTQHSVLPNRPRSSILSGLDVLECLAASTRPLGLSEVAAALDMARSSVHELLGALTLRGYVQRHADLSYSVGVKAWEVGCRAGPVEWGRVAEPYLAELVREVQEGASLAVLDGVHTVCIQIAESPQVVRVHSGVGERNPAHCVSNGLALLASLSDDEIRRRFASRLPTLTTRSISQRDTLLRELQRVRKQGYAICKGAWHLDVVGVAAAIPGADGSAVAAVSVALPRQRLTPAHQTRLVSAVVRTAQAISAQLVRHPPDQIAPLGGPGVRPGSCSLPRRRPVPRSGLGAPKVSRAPRQTAHTP